MAEQGAPNQTGSAGHHERNKVSGEGAVNASEATATSGGFEGATDRDPDAAPDRDLSGNEAPSMGGAVAQPGGGDPTQTSVAPGGDKISNPDVNGQDMARETIGEDKRSSALPGR